MTDTNPWARGYPVSESYPASWHGFQSPAHLRLVCAINGIAWEVGPERPLTVAEVGCGTGYTALMLAAGLPKSQVIGLDYNPAQIAEARSMASAAGLSNVHFLEADLAELSDAQLDRLPEFDLVTVHGMWSWVADPVRDGILRLLRRRLKAGGLALVSYNAMPGAASSQGLARLVRGALLGAGDTHGGITRAAQLVDRLIAAQPAHLPPSTWRRLLTGELKGARPGYLLHEFMTEHWRPAFHADVAAALSSARCDYVGSATLDENFPQLSLTPEQRVLWEEAPDRAARELMFDLCVSRAFRRDVFVRGARPVPSELAVGALQLAAASHVQGDVVLKAQAGEAKLPRAMMDSVRESLAAGPRRVDELRRLPGCNTATAAELAAVLVGSRCALPLWREPGIDADWEADAAAARRLNAVAAERLAPFGIGPASLGLASPAFGGGLAASAMELALAARVAEAGGPLPRPEDALACVRRLVPPGPMPEGEVLDELLAVATTLLTERAPVWRASGIA